MLAQVHKFEAAGLGAGPYRFLGVEKKAVLIGMEPYVREAPGSSCDYCHTGIMYEFWCESADGRRFKVGCDCIRKTSAMTTLYTTAQKAERELKRQAKAERLAARIAAAKATLADHPTLLTDRAHPFIENMTSRMYVEWLLANGGDVGRIRACKIIEAARA